MVRRATYKDVTWVDLENPTQSEVRALIDEFSIEPIVADELLSPTLRPKVDVHEKFIYLILHFPIAHAGHVGDMDHKKTQEVDFVIGKHFIITTHYDSIDALHDFSKIFEVNSILDKTKMGTHAGYVFYYMIQHFYRQLHNRVETIRDAMNEAERQTFAGNERAMVKELSILNRMLLTYKSALATHQNVLQSFEQAGQEFFGTTFVYHLRGIVGEYFKVAQALESTKEYLHELRSTNDSLLFTKQNEIIKKLTIIAMVTYPLSLIAAVFGMNTEHTPIVGLQHDFWIIALGILALGCAMFVFFKHKKWL
jgi:magnesium transporter